MTRPLLAVTLGDPNGIGPEVVLRAARAPAATDTARLVAVGSAAVLADQAARLGLGPVAAVADPSEPAPGGALAVWTPDGLPDGLPDGYPDSYADGYAWGRTTAEGGRHALAAVEAAVGLALGGAVGGIVTAPLSKEAIALAGSPFPGHTELLQARAGGGEVVMVLAAELPAGALRVALVTIHVPLASVAARVTEARVVAVVRTLDAALRRDLGLAAPRLAVLGLNPHAGDGGVLGRDEVETLAPALARLRADGLDVSGPFPADAFFGRAAWRSADAVVAMYHDQGLAPFKALAQGAGVNVTLGLPFVRTSPDHGTAFGIAGQGVADASSMVAAVRMAADIARRRAAQQR